MSVCVCVFVSGLCAMCCMCVFIVAMLYVCLSGNHIVVLRFNVVLTVRLCACVVAV